MYPPPPTPKLKLHVISQNSLKNLNNYALLLFNFQHKGQNTSQIVKTPMSYMS